MKSMETDQNHDENLSSPTLQTLKTLERSWTGGSNDSVQQWIDSLTEADFNYVLEERPSTPAKSFQYNDVYFLPVPNSFEDDELGLGAEAKSISRSSSLLGFSPRVSPLVSDNMEPVFPESVSIEQVNCAKKIEDEEISCKDHISDRPMEDDAHEIKTENHNEVQEKEIHDHRKSPAKSNSLTSIPSISSLLAAMEVDPEEMLRSLGFDDCNSLPSLHRVPMRFFANPSQAVGIDSQKIYNDIMAEQEEDSFQSRSAGRSRLLSRFSESSIDLSNYDLDDYSITKRRRSKLLDQVPSITFEADPCDTPTSEKNPPSRGSGTWRLSTVIEENEPGSRKSSFSKSERKFQLQKQSNVVEYSDNENQIDTKGNEADRNLLCELEDDVFNREATDRTLQYTAAQLQAFVDNSIDEVASDPGINQRLEVQNVISNKYCGMKASTKVESTSLDISPLVDYSDELKYAKSSQWKSDACIAGTSNETSKISISLTENVSERGTQSSLMNRRTMSNPDLLVKSLKILLPASPKQAPEKKASSRPTDIIGSGSSLTEFEKGGVILRSGSTHSDNVDDNIIPNVYSHALLTDKPVPFENNTDSEVSNVMQRKCNVNEKTASDTIKENIDYNDVKKNTSCGDKICLMKEDDDDANRFLQSNDCLIRQFSADSLETNTSSNRVDNSNNDDNNNLDEKSCIVEDRISKPKVPEMQCEESEVIPVRLVYRTLGKIENPEVTHKEDDEIPPVDIEAMEKHDIRKRRWPGFLGRTGRRKSDQFSNKSSSNTDLSCKIERQDSTEASTGANSSKIRDYLRRLTGNGMRQFFSMENLTTKTEEDNSGKSANGKSTEAKISDRVVEGADLHVMNFQIHEINEPQKFESTSRFKSQSLHDIYNIPSRSSGFFVLNRIRNAVKTRKISPPQTAISKVNNESNAEIIDPFTSENYNQIHGLGTKIINIADFEKDSDLTCKTNSQNVSNEQLASLVRGQDELTQTPSENASNVDCKTKTEENAALISQCYTVNSEKQYAKDDFMPREILNLKCKQQIANLAFTCSIKAANSVKLERSRSAVLLRGYSIESSGFEDETETSHSSPDRGHFGSERAIGKTTFLNEYGKGQMERPDLEKSVSSASCTSQLSSRDSLERQTSEDDNEVHDKKPDDDLCSSNQPRQSSPVEAELMETRQFDYIVNQITSLRKELHEQEERIKCYIDDGLERIKASILTEISISNAAEILNRKDHNLDKSLDGENCE